MSNDVSIDEARLTAEADAAIAAVPVDPLTAGAPVAPVPESWAPLIQGMTPMLRIAVFPQWNISEDEAREFSEALGQCLDQVFPGGLAGPYACWVRLMACTGGIVAMRVIQHGKLPPIGPRRASNEKTADAASPAA